MYAKVSLRTFSAVNAVPTIHPEVLMSSAGECPNGGRSTRAGDPVHSEREGRVSTLESDEQTREMVEKESEKERGHNGAFGSFTVFLEVD